MTSDVGRFETFAHACAFVLGFSTVFVMLGTALGGLGQVLGDLVDVLAQAGGIVIIVLGLFTLGVLNIPFLNYDTRRPFLSGRRSSVVAALLSSFMVGVSFSAGWTPCWGPVLGAILALSLREGTAGQGAFLLAGYSLGLGIPFLLTGLAVDRATALLRRLRRLVPIVKWVTGGLLVVIGAMVLVDAWHLSVPLWVPTLNNLRIWAAESPFQQSLFGIELGPMPVDTSPAFFVAVLAGLLSFLSPCVLPLVPVYIAYLSGQAVRRVESG